MLSHLTCGFRMGSVAGGHYDPKLGGGMTPYFSSPDTHTNKMWKDDNTAEELLFFFTKILYMYLYR